MEPFPHLRFVQKIAGKPRIPGGGNTNPITKANQQNRVAHSQFLRNHTTNIKKEWIEDLSNREEDNLAHLDEGIVPVFLRIDPDILNAQFDLESFGIEVISEENDGYIIGASLDNLRSLEDKINEFQNSVHGSGKIANLWEIFDGNRDLWRLEQILSPELLEKWEDINDDEQYELEVSIAFAKPLKKAPDPNKRGYESKVEDYRQKLIERDEQLLERQTDFEEFINHYGQLKSSMVDLGDSFGCEVSISGKGLRDLVISYPYVFEVTEVEQIRGVEGANSDSPDSEIVVLPPSSDSVEVVVIDSGIMEGHKYLAPAINSEKSHSYLDEDESTADHVQNGGHGTKVAGAILYPKGITGIDTPYQLPCFIRNVRILDQDCQLWHNYPAELMSRIVNDNLDCNIFNLSVNSESPFRTKHMSAWAAMLDKLSFEKDILFIISVGNILVPEIRNHFSNGSSYPQYLLENSSRLSNPSQSSFCIAVGSVNHSDFDDEYWSSIGDENEIAAYSKIGTGIWGAIKPDVVEYGGGLVKSKNGLHQIKEDPSTSPELIRSTLHGGGAIGRDTVGTSFATPKVTYLAAMLRQLYPEENSNLLRALIAQGARLPNEYFRAPSEISLRQFGYGIPSLERVTKNSESRITFYNTGAIKAEEGHVYSVQIPEEIRNPGDEFDILIEITLAYSAKVRRTRQKTKSYLSTWLDWTTSKLGESIEDFKNYAFKEISEQNTEYDKESRKRLEHFPWKIREQKGYGSVENINRNNSTLQKDWAIIKSYQLPEHIGIAIKGHKGWDKNHSEIPYAVTVSLEILGADIPIYESIKIENQIEIET